MNDQQKNLLPSVSSGAFVIFLTKIDGEKEVFAKYSGWNFSIPRVGETFCHSEPHDECGLPSGYFEEPGVVKDVEWFFTYESVHVYVLVEFPSDK